MSNYFWNFQIPYFNDVYGSDWEDFTTITDLYVDNVMNKTYQLYRLMDPNYFTTPIANEVMGALKLDYDASTLLATKKFNIRKFLTTYANKGLQVVYLDIQESIVGIRGSITSGVGSAWKNHTTTTNNPNRWGSSSGGTFAGALKWNQVVPQYSIYINVETTDNALLDLLLIEYRRPEIRPAFYSVFLVDSDFNYLRTV